MKKRTLGALQRWLGLNAGQHLDDKALARIFCRELSPPALWIARRHLSRCAECRERKQELEGPRAARMLEIYRESMDGAETVLPTRQRAGFPDWLRQQMRLEAARQRQAQMSGGPWRLQLPESVPALSFALVLMLAAGLGLSGWLRWQRRSGLTAEELLTRAVRLELTGAEGPDAGPGVVHQTVQIRTGKMTIRRSLYWERQGQHHLRRASLSAAEEELRARLDAADVDWNEPVSAASYENWRNHRHASMGRIAHSGAHLFTVTAASAEGDYARFADDMAILIDAERRSDWLVKAIDKRLREEFAKLRVEINEDKSRMVDLKKGESFTFPGFEYRRILSLQRKWRSARWVRCGGGWKRIHGLATEALPEETGSKSLG